jgi:Holliday junction resolvasome RuvABC endonuclease subunit
MDYLIGIDASTTNTGVSVFRLLKSGARYYKHHLLSYKGKKVSQYRKSKMTKVQKKDIRHEEADNRVNFMITSLLELLERYKPKVVVIEDIFAKTDINTMKLLGRIQGAVLAFCLTHDSYIEIKAPSAWRSDVGLGMGKREDLKKRAIETVSRLYDIQVTDDEADSILIGLSYIKAREKAEPTSNSEQGEIKNVKCRRNNAAKSENDRKGRTRQKG